MTDAGRSAFCWRLVFVAVCFGSITSAETPRVEPIEGPSPTEIQAAINRGVAFLVADQNENGSWGSATRTKDLNIFAPIPGSHHAFRQATTALCVSALIEADSDVPGAAEALERGEAFLLDQLPRLRRATTDAIYNVWGHAYSIQTMVRMYKRHSDPEKLARIVETIQAQLEMLDRYESVDGGWGYYDFRYGTNKPTSSSISFVNATALVAMHEASEIGVEPNQRTVDRAIKAIERQRLPTHSYVYGEYLKNSPMYGINRPGGSLGRSQACNVALRLWGKDHITDEVLETWLHRLFARNGWLDIGRKRPIPHEAWFQVAGYFYYYGHYYGALCIEELPEDDRPLFQSHMAATLLPLQEKDGSWWDYILYDYHQPYGTAFAIMTLERCK